MGAWIWRGTCGSGAWIGGVKHITGYRRRIIREGRILEDIASIAAGRGITFLDTPAARTVTGKGFKSFRDFSIQPGHMNLVIGANGTGKSNLAELFRFIARLPREGLRTAINNMGGENSVRTKTASGAPLKFHLEFELDRDPSRGIESVNYGFELNQSRGDIRVSSEWLAAKVYKRTPGKPKTQGISLFDTNTTIDLSFSRNSTQINHLSAGLERFQSDFLRGLSAQFDPARVF